MAEKRAAEKIYVTGHRVGKAGPYHTAIEYTDESGTHWISAGPEGGLLVSGQDAIERPTDSPALNVTVTTVTPPDGMSAGQYFSTLQQTDLNYCDCVDYDLFPGVSNSYNSNSYVSGLIQATGGSTAMSLSGYVGGQKPLPSDYFVRH